MPIPGQTITIQDPGLGLSEPAPRIPLIIGTCELGTAATLYTYGNKQDLITGQGQGPLSESACRVLDMAGGPIHVMPINGSVAGAAGAVTKTAVGASTGTVTVANAPFDAYEAHIEITADGTLGAGQFRYSLDDANSWSEEYIIPAGGVFSIPNTNLDITFVPGGGPDFFEDGDLHEFDCTAPYYAAADLLACVNAILALPSSTEFSFVQLVGQPTGVGSAASAATVFGLVEGHAATLAGVFRWSRWIMDGGDESAALHATAFASVDDTRVLVAYGYADVASSKPINGWSYPRLPVGNLIAARAAASLISTDLGRVASGSLGGVLSISHDEFVTETLDVHKISTLRSWIGRPGFYITNGRLKAAPGSDYQYWQYGRTMDVACRTVYIAQSTFINMGLRTNSDGTIDERDAVRLETRVRAALEAQLTQPDNAEGTRGHVSDINYTIDRTNNVVSTLTVRSNLAIRPLGYAKWIVTTIGYGINIGNDEEAEVPIA